MLKNNIQEELAAWQGAVEEVGTWNICAVPGVSTSWNGTRRLFASSSMLVFASFCSASSGALVTSLPRRFAVALVSGQIWNAHDWPMLKMYQDPICCSHETPHLQYTKLLHVDCVSLTPMGCTGFFAGTGVLSARPATTKTKTHNVRRAMTLQWSFAEWT